MDLSPLLAATCAISWAIIFTTPRILELVVLKFGHSYTVHRSMMPNKYQNFKINSWTYESRNNNSVPSWRDFAWVVCGGVFAAELADLHSFADCNRWNLKSRYGNYPDVKDMTIIYNTCYCNPKFDEQLSWSYFFILLNCERHRSRDAPMLLVRQPFVVGKLFGLTF